MSSSYIQPPVPTPVNPEDHSDNPDLRADQGDSPETVDPDESPDLPPIGDASVLRGGDAGPGEAADAEADVAAAADDVPPASTEDPSTEDPNTVDSGASGADTPLMDAALDARVGGGSDAASTEGAATGTDTTDPDAPGAEIGMTEGEGSTFEPEEDPEGHRDS